MDILTKKYPPAWSKSWHKAATWQRFLLTTPCIRYRSTQKLLDDLSIFGSDNCRVSATDDNKEQTRNNTEKSVNICTYGWYKANPEKETDQPFNISDCGKYFLKEFSDFVKRDCGN